MVKVIYKGKIGAFPRNCEVDLTLCGTQNTDELQAVEKTSCIWKPDGLVQQMNIFARKK